MNKRNLFATLLSCSLAGCLGDCKTVVKEANPYLDPQPAPVQEAQSQADPMVSQQWQVDKLGLGTVWQQASGSRLVKVAVIGSGVDYNHEDLRANILLNTQEAEVRKPGADNPADGLDNDGNGFVDDIAGWDAVENDGLPYDRTGTGTAAAGVIGARHDNGKGVKGINPNVSMIPVRYMGTNGDANVPRLVVALRYALARHVDVAYLHLANIDFTGGIESRAGKAEAASLKDVLGKLAQANTVIVTSAGNTGKEVGRTKSILKALTEFPNVLAVTSVDRDDRRPYVANFGAEVVLTSAPGEDILTTVPGNDYRVESGTYLAAAHVAGAVALALSQSTTDLTPRVLRRALIAEAASDPLPGMQFETTGGNRLNVQKFISYLAH